MIGRYVLAALAAGLIAGAVLTGVQVWRLSPLIAAAEVYEKADDAAKAAASGVAAPACKESMPGMKMCPDDGAREWEPAPGLPRLGFTGAASLLAGGGFALLLAGLSLLLNVPITRANGWAWGMAGFLSVHVATGLGLAPEVPGMPVTDLAARQIWWAGTIIATGAAIYCFAIRHEPWAKAVGLALLLIPHIIGAPHAPDGATTVPPALAAEFAANAIAAAAVFWLVMGWLLGRFLPPIAEKFDQ
ncbi:MAG: CbtA family protein [Alphaproteobacteria bacterium]|nr:CbtA family protein [Alphaproteobacteria bacterium]